MRVRLVNTTATEVDSPSTEVERDSRVTDREEVSKEFCESAPSITRSTNTIEPEGSDLFSG